jgi:GTP-sensing pleiotropic transcriptional regulator CodY
MAQGKKTSIETIYKIMQLYFTYGNYQEVARELDMPLTTVIDIVKKNQDKEEFVELRNKTRRKFSKDFERILEKAIKRLDREIDEQDRIPVNQLSTVIGTVYDKNRLENDESTENTNQTIKIAFNDDVEELSE